MFKATSRPPLGPNGARPAQSGLRALDPNARRCIVKARYVVMNAYGQDAARLHLRYLELHRSIQFRQQLLHTLYLPQGLLKVLFLLHMLTLLQEYLLQKTHLHHHLLPITQL